MKRYLAGAGLWVRVLLLAVCALGLAACKPGTPPDLLKAQRLDLDKANAVEGVLQERADRLQHTADHAGQ